MARHRGRDEAAPPLENPSVSTRQAGDDRAGGNPRYDADADAHPDDLDADNQGIDSAELLRRELGARVIDEIPNG